MLGYEAGNEMARVINITNPTPFMITIFFLIAAWFFRRSALKEDREVKAEADDHTSLGLNR
jgi:Na+/H+ antiporter NhaD/arsenite permease-like protein